MVETVTLPGIGAPVGPAVLPDGDLLIGSRTTGTIHRVSPTTGDITEVGTVPGLVTEGEGGLLGLTFEAGFVYAYYSTLSDNRVSRFLLREERAEGSRIGVPDHVITRLPHGPVRNGGALGFGPDGLLYTGTGEAGSGADPEDPEELAGRVLRTTAEGRNPAVENAAPGSPVFSVGHRNVTGLTWDALGRVWILEDDGAIHRPPTDGEGGVEDGRPTDPVIELPVAGAGMAWSEGSLWAVDRTDGSLYRVPLDGTEPFAPDQRFPLPGDKGARGLVAAPGEGLWALTETVTGGRLLLLEID
ncbi:PQQ-dependent sugar dehydrogenase [Streptomyces sp. ST2-7A]|nr:PQQ-dependent sugar dehydrogenase [Streptomyces sp. ST2-7A]